MKATSVAVGVLLGLAGCGGAPLSYPFDDLAARDRRFAGVPDPAQDLLGKEELTRGDLVALADALNPELASERKNIDLGTAAVWEAGLYPNPSAIFEIEDYRTRDGPGIGRSERTAGVSAALVISGRLGRATALAEAERDAAALQYLWKRREILTDVKRAFAALLAARRSAVLARESRDLAKAVRELVETRVRAQAAPEMEALKAAVSHAKAELDLKSAERDAASAVRALHGFVGDANLRIDRFAGDLATQFALPALEALRGLVLAAHPQLAAALKGKEAAELELALAVALRFPDPELRITAGQDPEDASIIEAGVSIPIPLFNRNQAGIARAETRLRQAELQIESTRNSLVLRLEEAHRTLAAGQERVIVYRDEILPKSEKALVQTQDSYRLGKGGYLDSLDAQRTYADARTAYVAALLDLNLAAVELEKLTGMTLESIR